MNYKQASKIHKYWSRKPGQIVSSYIQEFSRENELIFDPFCGSGTIGIEALSLGRSFLGQDLNPFAVFLSNLCLKSNFNELQFRIEIEKLKKKISSHINSLYAFEDKIILFANQGPKCDKTFNCVISDLDYNNKQRINLPDSYIKDNLTLNLPKGVTFPDREFPEKFYKDRFSYKGIKKVSDLFSRRNLTALAILRNEILNSKYRYQDLFMLALSNTLLHVSKLKSEAIRPLGVNNYWIPDDYIEENVLWRFLDRLENVALAKAELQRHLERGKASDRENAFEVFQRSSINLDYLEDESIDYLFTDPPYGDVIQYSELSFVWNTWLEFEFDITNELIVNPVQDKDSKYFLREIQEFFKESFRVLKGNRFFTLCFQNKDVNLWFEVAELAYKAGFTLHRVDSHDFKGSTFNKNWSTKSPKMDFYLTLIKKETAHRQERMEEVFDPTHALRDFPHSERRDVLNAYIEKGIRAIFEGSVVVKHNKKVLDNFLTLKSIDTNENERSDEEDSNLRLF